MFSSEEARANACIQLDNGEHKEDMFAGQSFPARTEVVEKLLNMPVGDHNGRSGWMWVHLANGDVVLGFFPQGDAYFEVEDERYEDYQAAEQRRRVSTTWLTPADVSDLGFGIARIH